MSTRALMPRRRPFDTHIKVATSCTVTLRKPTTVWDSCDAKTAIRVHVQNENKPGSTYILYFGHLAAGNDRPLCSRVCVNKHTRKSPISRDACGLRCGRYLAICTLFAVSACSHTNSIHFIKTKCVQYMCVRVKR
jgi:hypothetical protein